MGETRDQPTFWVLLCLLSVAQTNGLFCVCHSPPNYHFALPGDAPKTALPPLTGWPRFPIFLCAVWPFNGRLILFPLFLNFVPFFANVSKNRRFARLIFASFPSLSALSPFACHRAKSNALLLIIQQAKAQHIKKCCCVQHEAFLPIGAASSDDCLPHM